MFSIFAITFILAETDWTGNLNNGLVSYYKLDETESVVIDIHGSNDGTNEGATPNVAGKINTAYDFNSGYITLGTNTFDSLTGGSYSFSIWVYADSLPGSEVTYECLLDFEGRIMQMRAENAMWRAQVYSPAMGTKFAETSDNYNTGEWIHLVMVYDSVGDTLKLYVNSILKDTETGVTTPDNSQNRDNVIGTIFNHVGHDFDGRVDEVGIWDRVLSESEIGELYNSGDGFAYSLNDPRIVTLEQRIEILEEQNKNLEQEVNILKILVDKIVEFIQNLPKGLSKRFG